MRDLHAEQLLVQELRAHNRLMAEQRNVQRRRNFSSQTPPSKIGASAETVSSGQAQIIHNGWRSPANGGNGRQLMPDGQSTGQHAWHKPAGARQELGRLHAVPRPHGYAVTRSHGFSAGTVGVPCRLL